MEIHLGGIAVGRPRTKAGRLHGFGRIITMGAHTGTGAQQQSTGDQRNAVQLSECDLCRSELARDGR